MAASGGNVFNEAALGAAAEDGYSYRHEVCACANDSINNVEAVFLPPGTFSTGAPITITVTATNVAQGPQRFSVYAYNVRP